MWYIKKGELSTIQGLKSSFVTVTKALELSDKNGSEYRKALELSVKRYNALKQESLAIQKAFYCDVCKKSKITDVCGCANDRAL